MGNYGTIVAPIGISMSAGGHAVNGLTLVTNAQITASQFGVFAGGGKVRFGNNGTVTASGTAGVGADLISGGRVNNGFYGVTSALITGTKYGVYETGGIGQVLNTGTISGGAGVVLGGGTTFGTITNSGTIIGTGGIAVDLIHGADTVALTPGAVFQGRGVGASGYDILSRGAAPTGSPASVGTLSGLGTQFTGFTGVRTRM